MVGDHVRKRRLDLKLIQRDVAKLIGVDATTVFNWEAGRATPELRHMPRIIAFLGYDPSPAPASLPERLVRFRTVRGLSQNDLARMLGVDPTTLSRWETGKKSPIPEHQKRVDDLLG